MCVVLFFNSQVEVVRYYYCKCTLRKTNGENQQRRIEKLNVSLVVRSGSAVSLGVQVLHANDLR